MYRTLKAHKGDEEFEIVLCCGDTMPVPYNHYASKMPWWCLPFHSTTLQRLSLEYKITGFPSLVVVDSDGTLLKHDAVNDVMADIGGVSFPWRPRSLQDVLPTQYVRSDNTYAPISELDDKYILLFAAGLVESDDSRPVALDFAGVEPPAAMHLRPSSGLPARAGEFRSHRPRSSPG